MRTGEGHPHGAAVRAPDLVAYKEAVADLVLDIAGHTGTSTARAESVLTGRIGEPELVAVLSATPRSMAATLQRLLHEVRGYRPNPRTSAVDLPALIRISLLAQVDAMWWGHTPGYVTDADVLGASDLVDLDGPGRARPRFRYRRQPRTVVSRAARAAQRAVWPDRTPRTAGLRFTRTRPAMLALLNELARDFAAAAPRRTPPMWTTSLTRSIEHQHHLRALGYSAVLPSAHCVGYAADVEMRWFRRFGAHTALQTVLLERQNAGDVNVIDEGQAWHVCISPAAVAGLRLGVG